MKDMDEKYLHRKIFQPLQHLDMDRDTGYQKYYNEFFNEIYKKPSERTKEQEFSSTGKKKRDRTLEPLLGNLPRGSNAHDLLDKIRHISKKELAKHRALSKNKDFKLFQQIDLRNENEITLRDIASDGEDEYKDEKFDENPSQGEEEDEEMKQIDNLYEFWHEKEQQKTEGKRGINPDLDQRLEEYLRLHSQQLSLHV